MKSSAGPIFVGVLTVLCSGTWRTCLAQNAPALVAQVREAPMGLIFDPNGRLLASNRLPLLRDLVQAKLDSIDGQRKLIVMVEATQSKKQAVTTIRQEIRTRTITDVNGKEREQQYTVSIPVTEESEIFVPVSGRKPVVIDATEFRFFSVDGKLLPIEEAAERLKKLRPLFLLERFTGELPKLPDLYQQVLVEDCLIAVTEKQIRPTGSANMVPLLPPAAVR